MIDKARIAAILAAKRHGQPGAMPPKPPGMGAPAPHMNPGMAKPMPPHPPMSGSAPIGNPMGAPPPTSMGAMGGPPPPNMGAPAAQSMGHVGPSFLPQSNQGANEGLVPKKMKFPKIMSAIGQ